LAQPVLFKLPSHKIIFIATPKAGNSSILQAMINALPEKVGDEGELQLIQTKFREYAITKKEAFLLRDDHFIFSIVRNPWDRVVSHYSDKVVGGKALHSRLNQFEGFYHKMPFDEYLNVLDKSFGKLNDVHTLPQADNLFFRGSFLPNFVLRYERIAEDFALLKSVLATKNLSISSLPHKNRSKRLGYKNMYLNKEQIDLVRKLYRRDIKMFGYIF
jgi:hypothetical protein